MKHSADTIECRIDITPWRGGGGELTNNRIGGVFVGLCGIDMLHVSNKKEKYTNYTSNNIKIVFDLSGQLSKN